MKNSTLTPGDDFTISFWADIKEPTVGQLSFTVNAMTGSSSGTEKLTLVSSDGTTKNYRVTAGTNATDLGGNATSIQWDFSMPNPDSATDKAANLRDAINGSTGHNGKLIATVVGSTITIKQLDTPSTIGTIGNTSTTATTDFNSLVNSNVASAFSGGTDVDSYLVSKSTTQTIIPAITSNRNVPVNTQIHRSITNKRCSLFPTISF